MEEQITKQTLQQKNSQEINPRVIKYGLVYFIIIFIISSALISIGAYNILSYPKIYAGIYINEVYVGGETRESTVNKLIQEYQSVLDQKYMKVSSKGKSIEIEYKDIDAKYNIEAAVLKAFDVGRQGNFIKRLMTISSIKKNNVVIPLTVQTDSAKIEKKVKELANEINIPVKECNISIMNDRLIVKNGVKGELINIDEAVSKVAQAVQDSNSEVLEIDPEIVNPKQVNVEDLIKHAYTEPVNAEYEVKDYHITVKEHKAGITFDKEQAYKIIAGVSEDWKEYEIPLTITQPEFTKQALEKILFRDKLSSYTTTFNVNSIERSHNVVLAAEKINGIVLGPGDVFSYNSVVGLRSEETGFQNAKVYENGRVVDGIGGGICQTSSTLYNAVLYSDLEVLNRVNHSMTVTYVPMGQDATVVYGVIDFKFRNNTSWPIKVNSIVNKGQLTLDILGTNEGSGKTIEIQNEIIQTIPFATKIIDDPNLEEGKTVIEQKGSNGYLIDTYKITKLDGKVMKKELITKSKYIPLEKIERRGTKQVIVEPDKKPEQATEKTEVDVPTTTESTETTEPDVQTEIVPASGPV